MKIFVLNFLDSEDRLLVSTHKTYDDAEKTVFDAIGVDWDNAMNIFDMPGDPNYTPYHRNWEDVETYCKSTNSGVQITECEI